MASGKPLDGVYVVTQSVYHDRRIVGVAYSLSAAKKVVLAFMGMERVNKPFRWVDFNNQRSDWEFGRDQGSMEAVIDGSTTDIHVEWRSVQTAE